MRVDMSVSGFDAVYNDVNSLGHGGLLSELDEGFSMAARTFTRKVITDTPKVTGHTARGWQSPKRLGVSDYVCVNNTTTADGQHNVAQVLESGHPTITPKKGQVLFIPFSNKAKSKKLGAKVSKDLVYGEDYVFAKSVRPVSGRPFIVDAINYALRAFDSWLAFRGLGGR